MRIVMAKGGCKTAKALSKVIGCPAKYGLPKVKKVFVVSYGKVLPQAHLNSKIIPNKKKAIEILAEKGIDVPKIINKQEINNYPAEEFPVLGRKLYHTKGKDVIFIKTKEELNNLDTTNIDYYIKYIPKWAEYRVHVLDGEAKVVAVKVHDNKEEAKKNPVWNVDSGWKQWTYNGEHEQTLKELGEKAIRILGYDFGAIDVIRRDRKFYVLEVNSAPALIPERQDLYALYFKEKERVWKLNGRR